MTPLVVEEVVLHAGELSALHRKAVDRRNPFPCASVYLREEPPELEGPLVFLLEPCQRAQGRDPVEPGEVAKIRHFSEGDPALTLKGSRPPVRLAVLLLLDTACDFSGACRQPLEAKPRLSERGRSGTERGLQDLLELRKRGGQ